MIVDPAKNDKTEEYIAKLVELRQKKGMTEEQARELLLNNYLYYGVMMVKMGDADGMVSGACHSTADTLRPCLQILKTKPGTKLVSAFFLMVVPDCDMGADGRSSSEMPDLSKTLIRKNWQTLHFLPQNLSRR